MKKKNDTENKMEVLLLQESRLRENRLVKSLLYKTTVEGIIEKIIWQT